MTNEKATHPRARCNALNAQLGTCGVAFFHHGSMAAEHRFEVRVGLKHHIPWKLFGDDYAFCGRRPIHYAEPTDMIFLPTGTENRIRQAARMNVLCTTCFKNWMFLENRNAFIGDRSSW